MSSLPEVVVLEGVSRPIRGPEDIWAIFESGSAPEIRRVLEAGFVAARRQRDGATLEAAGYSPEDLAVLEKVPAAWDIVARVARDRDVGSKVALEDVAQPGKASGTPAGSKMPTRRFFVGGIGGVANEAPLEQALATAFPRWKFEAFLDKRADSGFVHAYGMTLEEVETFLPAACRLRILGRRRRFRVATSPHYPFSDPVWPSPGPRNGEGNSTALLRFRTA